jgi:hypothetical protein
MHVGLHVCYSCQILMKLEFFSTFFKSTQISNFVECLPVGAESFHADERTDILKDIKKLMVAFRKFANAPKNDDCSQTPQFIFSPHSDRQTDRQTDRQLVH